MAGIKVSVPVTRIAKFKTAIQLIALALLILSESQITILPIILIGKIALWIAGLLTLYTGYDYLRSDYGGEWFTLLSEDGKVLGISSAAHKGDKKYQVDGFCHPKYEDFLAQLIQTAVKWCVSREANEIIFNVSKEDTDKENLMRDMAKAWNLEKLINVISN